jgi:hypothetical protein
VNKFRQCGRRAKRHSKSFSPGFKLLWNSARGVVVARPL